MGETDDIYGALLRGPQTAAQLQRHLGLSQSGFQRTVSADSRILRVGRARATQYAARRNIDDVTSPIPVYQCDELGEWRLILTLHPVEPVGYYVVPESSDLTARFYSNDPRSLGPESHADLPWFLQDLRPAGFLGRRWIDAHPDEGYPHRLERWDGDTVLRYLVHYGHDLLGAFAVGAMSRNQAVSLRDRPVDALDGTGRTEAYPKLAERANRSPFGSSPGGEQPKFTVRWRDDCGGLRHGIVKFSPPMHTPGGRRWADLLTAEHVAHQVLRGCGFETVLSRTLDAGGRRFLEVQRFDRVGERGRRGIISLLPLDPLQVGQDLRQWSIATHGLVQQARVTEAVHQQIQWLESFGQLIANTDMHLGNLSLWLDGTTLTGLAPVYDMLPMFHAPRHGGEWLQGVYDPHSERASYPADARLAARDFWTRLVCHDDISAGFKDVARAQREKL